MKQNATDLLCLLALLLAGLVLASSRYREGIDLGDEGFLAAGAARVLAGEVPQRDFFSLQPPLSFYTGALALETLGPSLGSLRELGLVLHLAVIALVYGLARAVSGPAIAFVAASPSIVLGLPLFGFVPYAVWHGITFSLASACLVLRGSITGRRGWSLAAGMAGGLAVLSRHDQGGYLALAVGAFALALRGSAGESRAHSAGMFRSWSTGAAIVLVPCAIYWLAAGALSGMFRQLVLFPLTTYAQTSGLPMPWFLSGQALSERLLVAAFYVPAGIVALALAVLLRRVRRSRFGPPEARALFVAALAGLFYLQVLTRSDLFHLAITLPPAFALGAWLLETAAAGLARSIRGRAGRSPTRSHRAASAMVCVGAAVAAGTLGPTLGRAFLPARDPQARVVALDRAGVRVDPTLAQDLESMVAWIHRCAEPGQPILCLPYQPVFYFLADRRNPTSWNYLWEGDQGDEDHRELVRQAEADPPAVVVVFDQTGFGRLAPILASYLHRDYRAVFDSPVVTIHVPRARPDH